MSNNKTSNYLAKLLVVVGIVTLLLLWLFLNEARYDDKAAWVDLGKSIVPELLGPLITFAVMYLLFFRRQIDIENLLKGAPEWMPEAYENFDEIDWDPIVKSTKKMIITAYYFDEWIDQYNNSINKFLRKRDRQLIVYLPDYRNPDLMKKIHELIPEYSPEDLTKKIKTSIFELKKHCNNQYSDIVIGLYNNVFPYTFQTFDSKVYLSINQLNRGTKFVSPYFVLDLDKSITVKNFYDNELNTLVHNSEPLNISTWTT